MNLGTEFMKRQTTITLEDFNAPHYKINEITKNVKS